MSAFQLSNLRPSVLLRNQYLPEQPRRSSVLLTDHFEKLPDKSKANLATVAPSNLNNNALNTNNTPLVNFGAIYPNPNSGFSGQNLMRIKLDPSSIYETPKNKKRQFTKSTTPNKSSGKYNILNRNLLSVS